LLELLAHHYHDVHPLVHDYLPPDLVVDPICRHLLETLMLDAPETLVAGLHDLDALGVPATFEDVRTAVRDLLEGEAEPSAGFQRGRVYVGDLLQARGLRFRAVVVPGLVERSFPAPPRQDPILLDAERESLAARAGPDVYLARKAARADEEKMLFALALAAGTERVTLTFPRLDVTSGRERIPSHYLIRLAEALTGTRFDYSSLEKAPGFTRVSSFPGAADEAAALDLDDFDLRCVARRVASRSPGDTLYLAHVSPQFGRGVEVETARWQEPTFTKYDGIVTEGPRAVGPIAATRIEAYADCPFIYFLERVLGIEPLEEPEEAVHLTPLERGSLIHDAFYEAYSRCYGEGGTVTAETLAEALRRAAGRAFDRVGAALPALTHELDRAEILADLTRFASMDVADCRAAGIRPALFELRFGMARRDDREDAASTEEPFALDVGGRTVRFKGRIDRVDLMGEDGARVIDYKTGRKRGSTNAFKGGRFVQLPVYLLAADALLEGRNVARAEYRFATQRGGFATVPFGRAALEERMDELKQIVGTVVTGIEQGLFVPLGAAGNRCRNCRYAHVCGVNPELRFERKREDPAVAGLLELAEIK
jgi:RecB family exonuclease